jgi:hypothetical protein
MMSIPMSESQRGPVSIVTTLWAGRLGNLGLILHRGRDFCLHHKFAPVQGSSHLTAQ